MIYLIIGSIYIDNNKWISSTLAVQKNETEALKLLKNPNIDYNHVDEYGNTALIWACRSEMSSVVLKLLEKPDIDCNNVDLKWLDQIEEQQIMITI